MDLIMHDFARPIRQAALRGEPAPKPTLEDKIASAKQWLGSLYCMHPAYDPQLHPEHNPRFFPGSYVLHRWQRQRERDLMGVL